MRDLARTSLLLLILLAACSTGTPTLPPEVSSAYPKAVGTAFAVALQTKSARLTQTAEPTAG